jgi:hypothetical protein
MLTGAARAKAGALTMGGGTERNERRRVV